MSIPVQKYPSAVRTIGQDGEVVYAEIPVSPNDVLWPPIAAATSEKLTVTLAIEIADGVEVSFVNLFKQTQSGEWRYIGKQTVAKMMGWVSCPDIYNKVELGGWYDLDYDNYQDRSCTICLRARKIGGKGHDLAFGITGNMLKRLERDGNLFNRSNAVD